MYGQHITPLMAQKNLDSISANLETSTTVMSPQQRALAKKIAARQHTKQEKYTCSLFQQRPQLTALYETAQNNPCAPFATLEAFLSKQPDNPTLTIFIIDCSPNNLSALSLLHLEQKLGETECTTKLMWCTPESNPELKSITGEYSLNFDCEQQTITAIDGQGTEHQLKLTPPKNNSESQTPTPKR
jgi:hypothetical protein